MTPDRTYDSCVHTELHYSGGQKVYSALSGPTDWILRKIIQNSWRIIPVPNWILAYLLRLLASQDA